MAEQRDEHADDNEGGATNGLANGDAKASRPDLKRASAADLFTASDGTKSRKKRYARAVSSSS